MNKKIIVIGLILFFISFTLFMINMNQEKEETKNHNQKEINTTFYIENSELCKNINMKPLNNTHCIT